MDRKELNELLMLSRGARIPRVGRAPAWPLPERERSGWPGRLTAGVRRLRGRPARPALDAHQYLRLEFAVDDEPQPTRR